MPCNAWTDRATAVPDGARPGGGTMLYDAMYKAAEDTMQKQTGRKALMVMSDGVDTGSETGHRSDTIEAAQRADTLIYSILFFRRRIFQHWRRRGRAERADPDVTGNGGGFLK